MNLNVSVAIKLILLKKIFDIPLIIPTNNNYNLLDLLDYNFKDNVIFNDACLNCKKKFINHIKQIKFDILNDILIFSLQRIDKNLNYKNKSYINFEETIYRYKKF